MFRLPFILIGFTLVLMGLSWLTSESPWMLDRLANEERLGVSFDQLFSVDANKTLPNYLRQIYRFFGFWVFMLGLFNLLLSSNKLSLIREVRRILLLCNGILIVGGMLLGIYWIPRSPFMKLGVLLFFIYSISVYYYLRDK